MSYKNKPEDVWKHIDKRSENECWECNIGLNGLGYSRIQINGTRILSHRLAYQLTYGLIPDGLSVLHHCDNRKCCNPNHLFLGTYKDNSDDMISKGRRSDFSHNNNGMSKLSQYKVNEIRELYLTGKYTHKTLGKIYNINASTVGRIILKKTWR
jgi:hypothetical protein